jgi:hypothetical protein
VTAPFRRPEQRQQRFSFLRPGSQLKAVNARRGSAYSKGLAPSLSDDYTSEAVWVVEYFDEGVPDDPAPDGPEEWESFVVGNWNPWPMTARTRFVLWQALAELQTTLDLGLDGWQHDSVIPDDNDFMHDFPPLVRFEPRAWWEALQQACGRLWRPCAQVAMESPHSGRGGLDLRSMQCRLGRIGA